MRPSPWVWLPVAAISVPVHAATYLSVGEAQQLMFPGARFTEESVTLTDAEAQRIREQAGSPMPRREVKLWRIDGGGFFIVDEVIGKHELITYAVGLDAGGTVKQVEILTYRESYGYEIRNERWRRQFVGRHAGEPLRLGHEIQNIGGATLSCQHVTDGVERLLAFYDVALRK